MHVKSCLTLCDPVDCSPPGSSVHGMLGFSRQEYWSGLLCPPPGDLPNSGIKLAFPASSPFQAHSLPLSHQRSLLMLYPLGQMSPGLMFHFLPATRHIFLRTRSASGPQRESSVSCFASLKQCVGRWDYVYRDGHHSSP